MVAAVAHAGLPWAAPSLLWTTPSLLWAAPSDGQEFNSVTVSPGIPGFLAMFLLAVAVVLLAVNMSRRIRRLQAEDRVRQRMEADERERSEGSADDSGRGGPGSGRADDGRRGGE